jgi:hypothetical protein
MEARKKRYIKPGKEYDHLFPQSEGNNKTIRRDANVDHTVAFIPKVVSETLYQTKDIAKRLKGSNVYDTCSNIWHFVYGHINYKKDQEGYEQIRSPARVWKDRFSGVDCDCYSTFISSVLTNLSIPHKLRITKYWKDYYQHIYPVVQNGRREIILDCVTDKFNYEVPYSEKKDYSMDLQYLNGFDGNGMEDLGKIIKRNLSKKGSAPMKTPNKAGSLLSKIKAKKAAKSKGTSSNSSPSSVPAVKKKKKGFLKKIVSKINKINPATVLLRNGVLASMKLNIKNIAKRLRWSYLTPEQAAAKGILPDKYQKLVATRQKLENIFETAGGKVSNLKKAILGGKGNKDKAVSGLGMLPMADYSAYMNEHTPLEQLLGPETYYSENIEGMEGLGELGEPITLTSIAAAAGVLAGIVGALKQIGDIFGGKGKESADFDESKTDAPENNVDTSSVKTPTPLPAAQEQQSNNINERTASQNVDEDYPGNTTKSNVVTTSSADGDVDYTSDETGEENLITKSNQSVNKELTKTDGTTNKNPDEKQSFWDKNKTWLKPVAIGAGGLTLIAVGFHLMKGNKTSGKSAAHSLSGVPYKRKKKKHHRKSKHHKTKHHHKQAIALL